MKLRSPETAFSGVRLTAVYTLPGPAGNAETVAKDLCHEQTVEFPADLVPAGSIRDHVVGCLQSIEPDLDGRWRATVTYAVETADDGLPQLLNLLFGNTSLKPGIRLVDLDLPDALLTRYRGPRFGPAGLRERLGVPERPLLASALKPMGLTPSQLAELAYALASGGIDLIKDDHGIADQPFCPFDERVARCAEAVARANAETGGKALYVPNVTAPADRLITRARRAKEVGAGGLLVAPGLVGLDAMRLLADDDALGLPILAHPALMGSFVVSGTSGVAHGPWFGTISRLAGADAFIFPSYGGRFSFSREECRALTLACAAPLGRLRPILPMPAGGMSLDRVPELLGTYGAQIALLIGGDLHRHGPSLVDGCRRFRALVETR